MIEATLGFGGNIGDVGAHFAAALRRLRDHPCIDLQAVSKLYRTPPWGNTDQPDFLNLAAKIRTSLSAEALMALCLGIEREEGRTRQERWGPRLLDIDILTYGGQDIAVPGLTVPHPHLTERAFVLVPLAEIAGKMQVKDKSILAWRALADTAGIAVDEEETARLLDALANA